MTNEYGFPPSLLEQPLEQRLLYFKNPNLAIMHQKLKIAFDRVFRTIHEPGGASIILVIGPSGVGKSTLLSLLKKKILLESIQQMSADPGWIPIVCVEAPAPGKGTFRWKNFYKTILLAVDEPSIDQKIDYESDGISRNHQGRLIVGLKATEDSLRFSMEKALTNRHPYTLAVDEFQHIGKLASTELLQAHMDCVKSAVNITKVPWTGFGTYQLLNFLELSPQLSRRTKIIHFPRYSLDFDEDIHEFKRVLEHLQLKMPLVQTPPLRQKYWEFCYERSIGNIGTLIGWLTDAYDLCISENATTLTFEHLQETAKSARECEQMASEAIWGEEKLIDNKHTSKSLRTVLGFDDSQTKIDKHDKSNSNENKELNNQKRKQKITPFQRNPKRDQVGGRKLEMS
ncbi:AAA ATPase [Rivularia sp. IAM M-261]|nr:AAA ATPase [Rivularia sp. IAM M-261]